MAFVSKEIWNFRKISLKEQEAEEEPAQVQPHKVKALNYGFFGPD